LVLQRHAARLVVASLLAGCSTTATISRNSGADIEGSIRGGTPHSVLVDSESSGQYSIPRSDIREIDHPGNVHAVVGGVLLGYGVLNIALGLETCQNEAEFSSQAQQNAFCVGMVTPAVLGAGMLLWGLIVNGNSKSAANDTSAAEPYVPPQPAYPAYAPPPPPSAPPPPPPPAAAPTISPDAAPPPLQPGPAASDAGA
jgi:hypothetical protein